MLATLVPVFSRNFLTPAYWFLTKACEALIRILLAYTKRATHSHCMTTIAYKYRMRQAGVKEATNSTRFEIRYHQDHSGYLMPLASELWFGLDLDDGFGLADLSAGRL